MSLTNTQRISFALYLTLSMFSFMLTAHDTSEGALSGYTQEAVDLVEFLYGDGMLELGNTASIDDMFSGIDLNNKYILDIGAGIGGVDTYLAQNHTVTILGVDPERMLVERATQRANDLKQSFQGSVTFELCENNNLAQYADNTFDIVMSRSAILHVPHADKQSYFAEMLRVLKPGGLLIIDDWMHPSSDYTEAVREMMKADGIPYHLITPAEYKNMLTIADFTNITLRDTTDRAYAASADVCQKARDDKTEMIARFGEDLYLFSLESWSLQTGIFQRRELLTGIVTAQKSKEDFYRKS